MKKILISSFIILLLLFPPAFAQQQTVDEYLAKAKKSINENNYETAIEYLDKVLEIEPQNIEVLRNKGALLGIQERYDEATKIFEQVMELDPGNEQVWYNLARVNYETKNYYQAGILIEKFIEKNPNHLEAKKLKENIILKSKTPIDGIVQIVIRDSTGRLVGYSESQKLFLFDVPYTYTYMEKWPVKEFLSFNQTDYALYEFTDKTEIKSESETNFIGTAFINLSNENSTIVFPAVIADLYGLPKHKGDSLTYFWNFILPR